MDPQQEAVLPASTSTRQQISEPVREAAGCGITRRKAPVDRLTHASEAGPCIWPSDLATETAEVGRLCKATVRRAGIRAEIPGTLYTSCRHIERSPDLI